MTDTDTYNARIALKEALAEKTRRLAQESFLTFIQYMYPTFVVSRHHEIIAEHLEAVERGEIKRLIVTMPPRSGKSTMVSEYFPPWYLGRHPNHQLLGVSYTGDFAKEWGRKVRNMIASDEYRYVFPETEISRDSRASDHWATTKGGIYNSAGITSGIAGKGAHIGLIDDPLNEQDAYSKAAREHVIRWWPAGFLSRLMPGGRAILLSTRWNEEDLVGFVLNEAKNNPFQEQWTLVSIPAILDDEGSKLLGFPKGTTFWPVNEEMEGVAQLAGWPTDELLKKKASLPDYQWEALYMQRPTAPGGAILRRDWWQTWIEPDPPECQYIVISCDTAFSTKETADFSAVVVWGVFAMPREYDDEDEPPDHNFIALYSDKGRWEYPELRKRVIDLYEEFKADIILIEDKASGQSLIQELTRSLLPVFPYKVDRDKAARAHACTSVFSQGRVWTPEPFRHKWAETLIDECARFSPTAAAHDDLVDATTQAILWVRDHLMLTLPDEKWDSGWEEPESPRRRAY